MTPQLQRLIFLAGSLSLTGCLFHAQRKPSILPSYIQKLAVQPLSNQTQQYGLEDKLTIAIQSELNHDGRYAITTVDQADGVISGEITRYLLEPLSYDANHTPTEYKLTILVDAAFRDKVQGQASWKEPSLIGELRFFATTSGFTGSMSETDAQQVIWDQLARDIRTRTLEGFDATMTRAGASGGSGANDMDAPIKTPPPLPSQDPPGGSPPQQPY